MLAVLYDIHGNLAALDAVLDDAAQRGADSFVLGGDYAAFGPWPVQTLARLEGIGASVTLRGNHERWLTERGDLPPNPHVAAAVEWEIEQLDDADIARLSGLAQTHVLADTLLCHASPASDMASFAAQPGPGDAELLRGVSARRVVFGHTHLQFRRVDAATGIELVNPGSVGLPLDGDPRAAYATIAPDATLELHRVAYDTERFGAALAAIGLPWADWVASLL